MSSEQVDLLLNKLLSEVKPIASEHDVCSSLFAKGALVVVQRGLSDGTYQGPGKKVVDQDGEDIGQRHKIRLQSSWLGEAKGLCQDVFLGDYPALLRAAFKVAASVLGVNPDDVDLRTVEIEKFCGIFRSSCHYVIVPDENAAVLLKKNAKIAKTGFNLI